MALGKHPRGNVENAAPERDRGKPSLVNRLAGEIDGCAEIPVNCEAKSPRAVDFRIVIQSRTMKRIILAAMLSAVAATLCAQSVTNLVKRIVPYGQDGGYFYYQVTCANGTQGSVVVQDEEKNICAQAFAGARLCNAAWNVQEAAEQACR